MAGILANSASVTTLAADTSADNSLAGFAVNELITLSVTPTGTDYEWALGQPAASNRARSALSDDTGASVSFTPDVAGYFTVTCTVDSTTTYILRINATTVAGSTLVEAIRHSPKTDTTVAAPALGLTQFYSHTWENLAVKDPDGLIWPLLTGSMGAALTDADATITVAGGNRRVLSASTLTDNRTITLGTSGAANGDTIEIVRFDTGAYTVAVVNGGVGAGTLLTFAVSARLYAKFKFDGTDWALDERRSLS